MSKVIFKYGAMNSGKSLDLIKLAHNYLELGLDIIVAKPAMDTRSEGHIVSRAGIMMDADTVEDILMYEETLLKYDGVKAMLIDESNFLTVAQVDTLIDHSIIYGFDIIFYGVKNTFKGEFFEGSKRIMERADKLEEVTSLCGCGKKARQTGRFIDGHIVYDGDDIVVDDGKTDIKYVPLCNRCYYLGHKH